MVICKGYLQNTSLYIHRSCNHSYFFFFKSSPEDIFIDLRERERERERERYQSDASHTCPDQGLNLQFFGIQDDIPINWATQPGSVLISLFPLFSSGPELAVRSQLILYCIVFSTTEIQSALLSVGFASINSTNSGWKIILKKRYFQSTVENSQVWRADCTHW